jgi:putative ABC transport system permease protein
VDIEGGYNMRSSEMPEEEQIAVTADPVDEEFLQVSGLQLVAGSDLTQQDMKDVMEGQTQKVYHFILNESAAAKLGWKPEQAIGKRMFMDASRPGFVKGVVKDFHFESMHTAIKPLVLFPSPEGRQLLVKLAGNNLPKTLSYIEATWKNLVPERPFEYRFLDDDYNKLYNSELRLGKIMNLFASIAIILACLGLFGLSAYAAQQRIKEIGVRKVLGASVANIVFVLSKDFIKLSAIAILIAFPVAWWAMNHWLQNYQYRVNIEWWVFVITGIATVLLALLTISFQSIKAAVANPVKSLRTE